VFAVAVYLRGYGVDEAFMAVVGLAVAAIPEGLPAVLTIVLAIGVRRMAARSAIVRRLPAVETLGSVSVICSDKTGTLTRNEMMVSGLVTGDACFEVTGSGYAPVGDFLLGGREVEPGDSPELRELAEAAVLCNDAELREDPSGWVVDGDPMEGALVSLAVKAGLDPDRVRLDLPRDDEIPFDATHRFMATLHHSHEDGAFALVKGAPERVLRMCATERRGGGLAPVDAARWQEMTQRLASAGQRVLAFAVQPVPDGKQDLVFADLDGNATMLGLVGLIDPPSDEAVEAVRDCASAGIRVVMITGDHARTAQAIARQLGLGDEPKVAEGSAIDSLDDDALRALVREVTVFARTTPEHKLRLVEALQAYGLVVAMTGDGVNDAPALKRADVGVAMGRKGTEAAKEAAEMVLADDNFASIVAAVREGRTVYDNMVKVIGWSLPTNGGEALAIVAAIALGVALPITPLQILWVNMITAVTLGLTLAFEPTEPGTMQRRPRPAGRPILVPLLVWRVLFAAVLFVIGVFGLFYAARLQGQGLEEARTIAVNTLVVMEIFYLFAVRYVHGSALTWAGVVGTPAVLAGVAAVTIAQVVFTWWPPMQSVFGTRPLGWRSCVAILAAGLAMLAVIEVEKWIVRRMAAAARRRRASEVR
jgi:magnesium-transporting ATPase (P-type)